MLAELSQNGIQLVVLGPCFGACLPGGIDVRLLHVSRQCRGHLFGRQYIVGQSFADDAGRHRVELGRRWLGRIKIQYRDAIPPESTIYSALYPLVRPYLRNNNGNTNDDLSLMRKVIGKLTFHKRCATVRLGGYIHCLPIIPCVSQLQNSGLRRRGFDQLTIGLNSQGNPFVDTSRNDELKVSVTAQLDSVKLKGTLGFMQIVGLNGAPMRPSSMSTTCSTSRQAD